MSQSFAAGVPVRPAASWHVVLQEDPAHDPLSRISNATLQFGGKCKRSVRQNIAIEVAKRIKLLRTENRFSYLRDLKHYSVSFGWQNFD